MGIGMGIRDGRRAEGRDFFIRVYIILDNGIEMQCLVYIRSSVN